MGSSVQNIGGCGWIFPTYGEYIGLLGGVQGEGLELEVTVGDGQPGGRGLEGKFWNCGNTDCSPSGFQAIPATGLTCPSRASGSLGE